MIVTKPTYLPSGASRTALFDEIEKIAADSSSPHKPPRLSKILKSVAGYAGGYALGHGGGMLADKGLQTLLKDKYPTNWDQGTKNKVLFPLLGVATIGLMAARNRAAAHQQRLVEKDE